MQLRRKVLISLVCFLSLLFVAILTVVIINKVKLNEKKYDTFDELLINNEFIVVNKYEAGEEISNANGFSYNMKNKTTDYTKNKVNITVVELTDVNDLQKELDEYYNFYNSDDTKVERIEENYVSLKFVSDFRYNCLIGIDKYLIFIKTFYGNKEEETYDMIVDFINYKYPDTKKN